jgi:hypothetical protein
MQRNSCESFPDPLDDLRHRAYRLRDLRIRGRFRVGGGGVVRPAGELVEIRPDAAELNGQLLQLRELLRGESRSEKLSLRQRSQFHQESAGAPVRPLSAGEDLPLFTMGAADRETGRVQPFVAPLRAYLWS